MKVTDRPINSSGIESANQTKPGAKNNATTGGKPSIPAGATVEISDNAKFMAQAKELAMKSPDVRADKVANLKKSIRDGSYQVDSRDLADKILQDHFENDFGKNRI